MLLPIELMLARVERAKADSDVAAFHDLLYAGELLLRLATAGFIAGLENDRENHRYRLMHRLVRADGIGEWAQALDDALTGPASQTTTAEAREDRRAFTQRVGAPAWQFEAVASLNAAMVAAGVDTAPVGKLVALRSWFTSFTELRNKTRGHGAPTGTTCSAVSPLLEQSVRLIAENSPIFQRQWVYLHRNLSGKYRVVALNGAATDFDYLKSKSSMSDDNLSDGVYISFGRPLRADLITTNVDCADFFFPNGAFNGKRFELHSLISDQRREGNPGPYLAPALERPASETDGLGVLEVVGSVWTNMPRPDPDLISRDQLESELIGLLKNDRHPIVTLVGRGGIEKTSLALKVLDKLSESNRYYAIAWFSARDIDLDRTGPRLVKPKVLTDRDIADHFVSLMDPAEQREAGFRPLEYIARNMQSSDVGGPILFVFDNFETVRSPVDIFNWIDNNIRLPNKALITSRFRDFKADYPVEVNGMERPEAFGLIHQTAKALNSESVFTKSVMEDVFDNSDGHPYVIKILCGEISSAGAATNAKRIISGKDGILDALFERTYLNLSPAAQRVFLTLSAWRSLVPELAVQAVLLRHHDDRIDVGRAVDELTRMSLVQRITSADGADFLDVPLTASIFGQKKLSVSPYRTLIENDVSLLQDLGPTKSSSLKEGLRPRIQSLFNRIARRVSDSKTTLDEVQMVLEHIASEHPPAWILLADLYKEEGDPQQKNEKKYLRRFLESSDASDSGDVWNRLATIYKQENNVVAACGAFIRAFESPQSSLSSISSAANWLNNQHQAVSDMEAVDRASIFKPLASLMERHYGEASATDLSRLAWLYLHAGDQDRALEIANEGLRRDPANVHCDRLVERITR